MMIAQADIEKARAVPVLTLAERHTTLHKAAATNGGEYAGPCPFCGGTDRFHVQPAANRWFCRHCTGSPEAGGWQDVITLQMRLAGQSFSQAVQSLLAKPLPAHVVPNQQKAPNQPLQSAPTRPSGQPPNPQWQQRGRELVERAQAALWGAPGRQPIPWQVSGSNGSQVEMLSPLEWLLARGLNGVSMEYARLGYIPQTWHDHPAKWGLPAGRGVTVPQGILIPGIVEGTLWNLKIRRPVGKPKYIQVRNSIPALYLAQTLVPGRAAACITEGEFDALLLWQHLRLAANPRWRTIGVTTLGSSSTFPDLAAWARWLYPIHHFLLFYDQDGKSDPAIRFWQQLSERTHLVHWRNLAPGDKDLTDYHLSGGRLLDLVAYAILQADYTAQQAESEPPFGAAEPLPPTTSTPFVEME